VLQGLDGLFFRLSLGFDSDHFGGIDRSLELVGEKVAFQDGFDAAPGPRQVDYIEISRQHLHGSADQDRLF